MKDGFYEVGQDRGGTALRAGSGKVEKPRGGQVTCIICTYNQVACRIVGGNRTGGRSQAYIKFTLGI